MRVALAEDSVLFREGVARLLEEAGMEVVGQVSDADSLLEVVDHAGPDVVIVDVRMPPTNTNEGLVAALRIRDEHPNVGVLVLSHYVETLHASKLIADRAAGVGYLLKDRVADTHEFVDAVRRVASGGSALDPEVVSRLLSRRMVRGTVEDLTEREIEVLGLMAQGLSNGAISKRLYVTPKTVESHVSSILGKLELPPDPDIDRRVAAVLHYLEG
jgi:DNA-binding NarL/FixJ family response regulator